MIIISDYELRSNKDDQIICLSQEAHAYCPECSGELSYRDSRLRICRTYGGETFHIQIRRLKCHRCHRLHNELPNILVPHKHYCAEVIEDVVDEVVTPEDVVVEDYPCAATMERWKDWICRVTPAIDSMLRSIGCRMLNFTDELLFSSASLLGSLRDGGGGWMATVMHTLCNAGCAVPT